MRRFTFIMCTLILLMQSASAQVQGLIDEELFDKLVPELSGERALEHVRQIASNHRVQATSGYHAAAEYVMGQLMDAGVTDVKLHKYKSDGKKRYNAFTSPLSWTIKEGVLRMLEPENRMLARYSDIPASVSTLSNGGKWKGELVEVGTGTSPKDYEGKDVKGKIVYASGYAGLVHRAAVIEKGALGVVIYPGESDRPELLDAVRYNGLWPTHDEKGKVGFGFQVSRRQSEEIKKLLENGGKVLLEAEIDAKLHSGELEVISALIPGTDEAAGQFVLMAHLDHYKPGANDNASGSAALLETAVTINRLISEGKIDRPRRAIRFLWVPEYFGTIAYLTKHRKELEGAVGGMNLDMVGENTAVIQSKLSVVPTPVSLPSFLNDLVLEIVQYIEAKYITSPGGSSNTFNYAVKSYTLGSDHDLMNDPLVGVPTVAIGFWDDKYHHTNEDSEDKVDPTSLKRCMAIGGYTALWIASAGNREAEKLVELEFARGRERLIETSLAGALNWMEPKAREIIDRQVKKLNLQIRIEKANMLSINTLDESSEASIDMFSLDLDKRYAEEKRLLLSRLRKNPPEEKKPVSGSTARIPKRLFIGPVSDSYADVWFRQQLGDDYDWYRKQELPNFEVIRYETVNLIDGVRRIQQIHEVIDAAYGPVSIETVENIIDDLARLKLIEFVQL